MEKCKRIEIDMEKCKRIETGLPESMIQQIQSLLSEKEAARTTLVSKSWYNAWLTRPVLVLRNLHRKSSAAECSNLAMKAMRRYHDANLKIESLSLKMRGCRRSSEPLARKLIADAMKLGATDLKLEFYPIGFALPAEVLGFETLLRLTVSGCKIDGNVNWSMLKSLSLDSVLLKREDDMLRIITSCCNSIEELSLSNSPIVSYIIELRWQNLHEFHKLKRLYLERVPLDNSFTYLESQCPCLEDLSLVHCYNTGIHVMTSSSLKRISIVQLSAWGLMLTFEVPKLAVFSYSGIGIPSLSIKAREEWESHISMKCYHNEAYSSWYRDLHKLLTHLNPSRISLTIDMVGYRARIMNDIRGVAIPAAVESLRLETKYDAGCILRCLFRICRPKLVTHCLLDSECWKSDQHSLKSLCEKLVDAKRGRRIFELKEGKMEVYEEDEAEWRPLLLQDALTTPPMGRNVRLHLKW